MSALLNGPYDETREKKWFERPPMRLYFPLPPISASLPLSLALPSSPLPWLGAAWRLGGVAVPWGYGNLFDGQCCPHPGYIVSRVARASLPGRQAAVCLTSQAASLRFAIDRHRAAPSPPERLEVSQPVRTANSRDQTRAETRDCCTGLRSSCAAGQHGACHQLECAR